MEKEEAEIVIADGIRMHEDVEPFRKKYGDSISHETVGAVAIDIHGDIACATSTGGITFKKVGIIFGNHLVCYLF